jgi:ferredoxin
MAYVITQKCVGTCDTSCVDVCPVGCILGPVAAPTAHGAKLAGIQMFIDPQRCIACGACVDECPARAIYLDAHVPEAHRGDIARNAQYFLG